MIKIYYNKIYFPHTILRGNKIYDKNIKLYNSKFIITPILLHKTIHIYNGKKFMPIYITKKKIGFKLNNYLINYKSNILKQKDYYLKL